VICNYYFMFEFKPKSVTLEFKCWFSEAGFGELMVPNFHFAKSRSGDLPLVFCV
jgi:hypothetical protein